MSSTGQAGPSRKSARFLTSCLLAVVGNVYCHVIIWKYGKDWTEPDFRWDFLALCGDLRSPVWCEIPGVTTPPGE
ncbi:MAG TPA: hypothetical protein VES67_22140 [Vicinamibacterales bacterium]|nr:hypothetical protein [Vicinamibacterales bacterium]